MSILNLRRKQLIPITKNIDTLQSIEINPIDNCNRACGFCPRGHGYPNTKNKLEYHTCYAINQSLIDVDFKGRISFVGFGEPTLHKQLAEHISIVTKNVKAGWVEVNTNGDFIDREIVQKYIDSGLTHLTISMYDKDDSIKFKQITEGLDVTLTLRHCYDGLDTPVNRVEQYIDGSHLNKKHPCYLPFYKMMIDYNGDVLLCANDWSKTTILGNVNNEPIGDIWFSSKYKLYRQMLLNNHRSMSPCSKCDIDGTKIGESSFEHFRNIYNE